MTTSLEQAMKEFHYVNLDMEELSNFAFEHNIAFDVFQLSREIRLLTAVAGPLATHMESFKSNWTFQAINDFTKSVKRIFTNRKFKASDADNIQFHYNEHLNQMQLTLKPCNGLSEISKLTISRNMFNHLEYLKKGINVKSYFQLRDYIEKFGHEETAAVLKRKKMDLNNIYKRVDNRRHIDEVLKYERTVKELKIA